jgi:hypothetical protein
LALAGGGTLVGKILNGFPLTLDVLRKLTTSTIVDNTRMIETLPDLSLSDFREALDMHSGFYRNI